MSKSRRWRLLWRAVRYGRTVHDAARGEHVILQGYRTRAVDRMRAAYPGWPHNSNGSVRGWRL